MASLPMQGKMIVPIKWSARVHKQTMRYASTTVSGTLGVNPTTRTATIEWVLMPDEIMPWLTALGYPHFNEPFDYTCPIFGALKLRPTDQFTYAESFFASLCSMTFEVV